MSVSAGVAHHVLTVVGHLVRSTYRRYDKVQNRVIDTVFHADAAGGRVTLDMVYTGGRRQRFEDIVETRRAVQVGLEVAQHNGVLLLVR